MIRFVFLLTIVATACKQQDSPKAPEKQDTGDTRGSTLPPLPAPPAIPQSENGGNGSDNYDSDGCSSTDCKNAGPLEVNINGKGVTILAVPPQTTSTWTLTVKSPRYEGRTFLANVTSDVQNLAVSENDSSSVKLTWTPGANVAEGQLKIRARDQADSSANDEDLVLRWSTDSNAVANAGVAGGTGSNVALGIGFQLLSNILGLNGPMTMFGTNDGQFGGGFPNAQGYGAYGNYGNGSGFGGTANCNNGYGNTTYGSTYGNQYGNDNTYGNNTYGNNTYGNNTYGNTTYGNTYGNQNGNCNSNYNYGNTTYGSTYGNGAGAGTYGTCSASNCARCTETRCSTVGCSWDTYSNVCR